MRLIKIFYRTVALGALFCMISNVNPALAQPPIHDPHTPGYVSATELPDGAIPSPGVNGNFIIGPTHDPAPESLGRLAGLVYHLTMESRDSKIYPGIAR